MDTDRDWWGTLKYPGSTESLRVALIASFRRDGPELAAYPVIGRSGPKDYVKNQIWTLLQVPGNLEVYLVRGRGPMFPIVRRREGLCDADGERVLLDQGDIG